MKYLCIIEMTKVGEKMLSVCKDFYVNVSKNDDEGKLILHNLYEKYIEWLEQYGDGRYYCTLIVAKEEKDLRENAYKSFHLQLSERERNSELGLDSLNFRVSFWLCVEKLEDIPNETI